METDIKLQNQKLELIRWLSTIEDSSIVKKIMELRDRNKDDWWHEISEEEKESIKKGLEDANAGKLKPHSKVKKIYEKWL